MTRVTQENVKESIKGKEIDLKEYYEVIKKRIWIVVIVALLTTVVGSIYSNRGSDAPPLYETSTRMIIGSSGGDMKTLLVMMKDRIIMKKVSEELGLTTSPEGLAGQITISRMDESQVIQLSVVDTDPKLAMDIANTTAEVFKSEISDILNFNGVQLLSPAEENASPINMDQQGLSFKIFLVIGIILGIGFVFLLDSLDDTIKRENEIENILGVPVVGVITNMNKKQWSFKKSKKQKLSVRGEAFDVE
jgi:capsular polysaccharide biosynthesis protein